MQSGPARLVALLILAVSVAGCTTAGTRDATLASGIAAGPGTTLAFESIDGPPPAVFQRLVQKLNDEANARQMPIVTREGFAPYRIRGYVAVGIRKRQAVVSWVWDVYDARAGRALRLSGEEKAGPAGRDAWQGVNDEVLRRVARSGMEQLAVYFSNPGQIPSEPAAPASGPAVASADSSNRMALAAQPLR